jgi:hypothetical protein
MKQIYGKMEYFWNTFVGGLMIGLGTMFQIKAGIFLTSFSSFTTGLEITNAVLSVLSYIFGLTATSITIYKFLKEKKADK